MCGIVGYLGKGEAYPALIKGLKRLEYRGYDSAGVALIGNDGSLNVYKAKGKVADLEAFCADKDISGHVANLLQLQCTFQGYRILESATQIDEIASVCKRTAQISYLIVQLQHFLHLGRNVPELICNLLVFAFADGTSLLTDGECQEDENGNLTGECLGRGNTDFRTHVNVGTGICFTGDGRADGITDTIDERTIFLGKLDGLPCSCMQGQGC